MSATKPVRQGDILRYCPIFVPDSLNESVPDDQSPGCDIEVPGGIQEFDVVVLSQSCDLASKKITQVLVGPVWPLDTIAERNVWLRDPKKQESLRRGYIPGLHLLNKCNVGGFNNCYLVVDFRNVYGVHFDFLVEFTAKCRGRISLKSPYREHLAQAFARFFMRVGLPVDIPSFAKQPDLNIAE